MKTLALAISIVIMVGCGEPLPTDPPDDPADVTTQDHQPVGPPVVEGPPPVVTPPTAPPADSGTPPVVIPDAGTPDAGQPVDAGSPPPDAGSPPDAGTGTPVDPPDAGPVYTGPCQMGDPGCWCNTQELTCCIKGTNGCLCDGPNLSTGGTCSDGSSCHGTMCMTCGWQNGPACGNSTDGFTCPNPSHDVMRNQYRDTPTERICMLIGPPAGGEYGDNYCNPNIFYSGSGGHKGMPPVNGGIFGLPGQFLCCNEMVTNSPASPGGGTCNAPNASYAPEVWPSPWLWARFYAACSGPDGLYGNGDDVC